jgi:hypothetical protein
MGFLGHWKSRLFQAWLYGVHGHEHCVTNEFQFAKRGQEWRAHPSERP